MLCIVEIITVSHDDPLARFYEKLKEYPDEWTAKESTGATTYKRIRWINVEQEEETHSEKA